MIPSRLVVRCSRCGQILETSLEGGMPPEPVHTMHSEEWLIRQLAELAPSGTLLAWNEVEDGEKDEARIRLGWDIGGILVR